MQLLAGLISHSSDAYKFLGLVGGWILFYFRDECMKKRCKCKSPKRLLACAAVLVGELVILFG
jgi:hypothetical protein